MPSSNVKNSALSCHWESGPGCPSTGPLQREGRWAARILPSHNLRNPRRVMAGKKAVEEFRIPQGSKEAKLY